MTTLPLSLLSRVDTLYRVFTDYFYIKQAEWYRALSEPVQCIICPINLCL